MKEEKIILIVGAIHGNEIVGVEAFNLFEEFLSLNEIQISGYKFQFLLGNPKAFLHKKRFIDSNLNRVFNLNPAEIKSFDYEILRSFDIKEKIKNISNLELVVDLHSVSVGDIRMMLYLDQKINSRIVKKINLTPIEVLIDPSELPGTLVEFCNSLKIPAVAIECGNHFSHKSIDFGFLQLLEIAKMLALKNPSNNLEIIKKIEAKQKNLKSKLQRFDSIIRYKIIKRIDAGDNFKWLVENPTTGLFIPKKRVYACDSQNLYVSKTDSYLLVPDLKPKSGDFGIAFLGKKIEA